MTTLETARILRAAGVACIPLKAGDANTNKRPALPAWKDYQNRVPTDDELTAWFTANERLAIVAGKVRCIDIDTKRDTGDLFERFNAQCRLFGVEHVAEKCILQRTQSGGYHLIYSSDAPLANVVLAQNKSKETLVETRGAGGYFAAYPTAGYNLLRGDFQNIPALTSDEEDSLLCVARLLHELPAAEPQRAALPVADVTPGDDYDARCDMPELLRRHGWTSRDGKHWTRPGKDKGTSATWDTMDKKGRFYPFSTNAAPFEPRHCYRPWHVYAVLEHGGNFAEAAKQLKRDGYGQGAGKKTPPATTQSMSATGEIVTSTVPEPTVESLPIYSYDDEEEAHWETPPELIQGCLYMGAKGMLAGPSKIRKTYLLTDLGISVASGTPWLGIPTTQAPVLYVNLELQDFAFRARRREIVKEKLAKGVKPLLFSVHGRGHCMTFAMLKSTVERAVRIEGVRLIIVDPIYKLNQGIGDENNAGDVGKMLNDFEALCRSTGAALFFAHHFAKGNAANKNSIDRMSGSGVFARDPDAMFMLTPHKEENCVTVETHLRNFKQIDPFVLSWNYPLWERNTTLDASDLEQAKTEKKHMGRPRIEADELRAALESLGENTVTSGNIEKLKRITGWSERTIKSKWSEIK